MRIDYQILTFSLEAKDVIVLPSYKGSTFRGGFGNAFRKIVCALKKSDCADCILKEKCVYSYVFETPPPSDTKIMRKYKAAPHPFIIEPPTEKKRGYKPGDKITFGLTLIGKAVDYLPYFIYAFDELGKIGIGKGRGKYELKTVKCENNHVIPAKAGIQTIYESETKTLKPFEASALNLESETLSPQATRPGGNPESHDTTQITLNFLTPTRILYDNHLTLDLEFHILVRNLLRRLSLLYYFHCGGDTSTWDFKEIIKKAEEIKTVKKDLRWYDWERYSARQDARMKMGGFMGEITFEGDIDPFMHLIKAGEILHVGKGTSFGLGKYEVK